MRVLLVCILSFLSIGAASAQDSSAAVQLNEQGLDFHRREEFARAQELFVQAAAADPGYSIARFNAACAAARALDVDAARAHLLAYAEAAPLETGRILHDPDLTSLYRADPRLLESFRERIRGRRNGAVRSLIFERHSQDVHDLFMVSEDGLDLRQITTTPSEQEFQVMPTRSGDRIVFMVGRGRRSNRNVSGAYELIIPNPDGDLHSMDLATGRMTTLAARVHTFRLASDGETVLFVDRPTDNGPLFVRSISSAGGSATQLAELEAGTMAWCPVLERDRTLLMIEAAPDRMSRYRTQVARYREGRLVEVLIPRVRRPRHRFNGFTICAPSADGRSVHLGPLRFDFDPTPRLVEMRAGLLGSIATVVRNWYGDTHERRVLLTINGQFRNNSVSRGLSPISMASADGDDVWSIATRVANISWDGSETLVLSADDAYGDYAPDVAPEGDLVAWTGGRRSQPWIVISSLTGDARRPIVPGQYPVWLPRASSIQFREQPTVD